MKVFEAIDGFLSESEFDSWSKETPRYEHLMVRRAEYEEHMGRRAAALGFRERDLMSRCRAAARQHYPDLELVDQVAWPRLNQIPIGQTKAWHVDPGIVSCVYHVTPGWVEGGELTIAPDRFSLLDVGDHELVVVDYVPNRLVIFNASLPHMVCLGKQVRYTLHVPFGIA